MSSQPNSLPALHCSSRYPLSRKARPLALSHTPLILSVTFLLVTLNMARTPRNIHLSSYFDVSSSTSQTVTFVAGGAYLCRPVFLGITQATQEY